MKRCPYCGNMMQNDYATECNYCHRPLNAPPPFSGANTGYQQSYPGYDNTRDSYFLRNNAFDSDPATGKSRGIAGLLAIFFGSLGVQYFYLGKTTPGVVFLLVTLLSCGGLSVITGLLSLIQGIMMLCMSNAEFDRKYVSTTSSFPLF